ncbi:hypothetical protein LTR09_005294 [Extremus antarcticus]|uniref:Transport protein particle subunit trs85-2 n=1 Tax=Extremus antarcticus TaxID=702011 RepID=A0AAJ0DN27_9PEZI|nr:hypothetical protein LTR09_005294 [Extremus antarcticus]
MPSQAASPVVSPPESDSDASIYVPRQRRPDKSPLASIDRLPYRRSNASLSDLFASTSSLPGTKTGSDGTQTPPSSTLNGSVFSPRGSTIRSSSPVVGGLGGGSSGSETRDVILRAFSPHVSVLASQDTEELIRHKGIHGGLLELLRPFGEHVPGKVTIRDSSGASRSYEDYAVRFVGVKDGLESPRAPNRTSTDSTNASNGQRASMLEYKPARLRSGGDVPQIEDLIERHLTFAEEQSSPLPTDYLNHKSSKPGTPTDSSSPSPFYLLYLRRLLSGLPLVPSETLSHPVASIIAISSRSPSPIEELRTLYASSNTGPDRLPPWVHNEFLRYYVLIHDEDYDSIQKSTALYDQMKRHFGLHCHLLRLRSTQCLPSDDDSLPLPTCEWTAAAEDLAEITRRETSEDDGDDQTPCIFESDAANVRAFVREMVTQSLVPALERASATWNDQVASRRRGISGRFMSLSKRFTTFGSSSSSTSSNRNSSVPSFGAAVGSGSNYDPTTGSYLPNASEAVMRRLGDYAMVLRDYKLAQGTYEILTQDFKGDKAWRHYAGANEMLVVSSLLLTSAWGKARSEAVETAVREAYYTYISRAQAPYYALRTLVLAVELLRLRGGSGLDDAARWASRILEDRLVGPVGHVLVMERIASCCAERTGVVGLISGERRRKAAFWNLLACSAWLGLEKGGRAEECLAEATRLYQICASDARNVGKEDVGEAEVVEFGASQAFLAGLRAGVRAQLDVSGPHHLSDEELMAQRAADEQQEAEQQEAEPLQDDLQPLRRPSIQGAVPTIPPTQPHGHRKSISISASQPPQLQTMFDSLGAVGGAYESTPSAALSATHAASHSATQARRPSGAGAGVVPMTPLVEGMGAGAPLTPVGERGGAPGEREPDDGFE